MAESLSSNNNAIEISTTAHTKLIHLDWTKLIEFLYQSTATEDARELIEELNVDIAADNIPAISRPFNPIGKVWTIKVENSRSFSIEIPW